MATSKELERQTLDLPAAERERLARLAWASVSDDPGAMADASLDSAGIELAEGRDEAMSQGSVKTIGSDEFRRKTGGG